MSAWPERIAAQEEVVRRKDALFASACSNTVEVVRKADESVTLREGLEREVAATSADLASGADDTGFLKATESLTTAKARESALLTIAVPTAKRVQEERSRELEEAKKGLRQMRCDQRVEGEVLPNLHAIREAAINLADAICAAKESTASIRAEFSDIPIVNISNGPLDITWVIQAVPAEVRRFIWAIDGAVPYQPDILDLYSSRFLEENL